MAETLDPEFVRALEMANGSNFGCTFVLASVVPLLPVPGPGVEAQILVQGTCPCGKHRVGQFPADPDMKDVTVRMVMDWLDELSCTPFYKRTHKGE